MSTCRIQILSMLAEFEDFFLAFYCVSTLRLDSILNLHRACLRHQIWVWGASSIVASACPYLLALTCSGSADVGGLREARTVDEWSLPYVKCIKCVLMLGKNLRCGSHSTSSILIKRERDTADHLIMFLFDVFFVAIHYFDSFICEQIILLSILRLHKKWLECIDVHTHLSRQLRYIGDSGNLIWT